MFDLQFQSFDNLNVYKAAESSTFGRFWVVFFAIPLLKYGPSLHGGSSQNMFTEVADNIILLIYFSVKAFRYIT